MSFTNIPLVPDPIPIFASDLEIPTWIIDRNPTPINSVFEEYRRNIYRQILRNQSTPILPNSNHHISNDDFIPFNSEPIKHNFCLIKTTEIYNFECSICYENISNNCSKLNCNHLFCNNCIKNQIQKNNICCALCRQIITEINSDNINEFKPFV